MYTMLYSCCNAVVPDYVLPSSYHFVFESTAKDCQGADNVVIADIPLDLKISQLFMVSIDGSSSLPSFSKRFLAHIPPGAVLLFRKNISHDIYDLFNYIESVKKGIVEIGAPFAPLVCIDHEGGSVARLRAHTSYLPPPADIASVLSPAEAEVLYYLTGLQMSAAGVSLNLAPLAEFRTTENTVFLKDRIYSDNPAVSAVYASAAVRGFRSGGIQSAVKHFPGNTGDDPHQGLPVLSVSNEELYDRWLLPFVSVFNEKPAAVVLSHVICPVVEASVPVCFSQNVVTGLLQESLGFNGVIISDDLCMEAVRYAGFTPEKAAVAALQSGCSLLMISGNENLYSIHNAIHDAVVKGLIPEKTIDSAVKKIFVLKSLCGLTVSSDMTKLSAQSETIRLFCFAAAKSFARQFLIQKGF